MERNSDKKLTTTRSNGTCFAPFFTTFFPPPPSENSKWNKLHRPFLTRLTFHVHFFLIWKYYVIVENIYIYFLNGERHRKRNNIWQVRKITYVIILYDKYIVEGLKAGRIYFPSKFLSDIFRQNKNTRWEFDRREKTKDKR